MINEVKGRILWGTERDVGDVLKIGFEDIVLSTGQKSLIDKFYRERKMKKTAEVILITIAAELDTIKEIMTSNLGYIKDVDDDTELVVSNIEAMIDMAIRTKSQIDRMLEK